MRILHGLSELALALEEAAIIHHESLVAAAGISSLILEKRVVDTFGDSSKLATLAQVTQDERVALGYTPNDPLLRDGSLLRHSVERVHEGLEAGVGSSEPVMLYSEMGFVSARSGTSVPPRPVFKIGMQESEAEIVGVLDDALSITFGGTRRAELKVNP